MNIKNNKIYNEEENENEWRINKEKQIAVKVGRD